MKKLLLSLLVATITFGYSQTTNKGNPKSWSIAVNSQVEKINVQTIDIQRIILEDATNDLIEGKPYRVGMLTNINYGLNNSGIWTILPNGDRFWRLNISSKDALNLSVNFDDFYIPEGASLYLYNNEKSDLQGAYTNENNNENNALGSWFVKGDNLWIEYFEPSEVNGQGKIHLSEIIHGYRLAGEHQNQNSQRALNDSGACNHDVDCTIGADFDSTKDELKHSVAFLNMGNGFICSGGLINNVNNDKTPFFLSANHCYGTSNPALYSMRFNWITNGTPRCGTSTNSSNGATNFVMNGSTLRAKNVVSDFMLVELNNDIPDTWDIRYAGWDRTDTDPTYEIGIHHPSGDIMKVCRDNDGASKVNINSADGLIPTWFIGGLNASNQDTFGTTGWEIGVTEGGSSGSPLFDQNGRVIGQLWAGLAACTGTSDNNRYDYYGRFASSWIGGGTNATRLSNWLDPDNVGVTTVDMLNQSAGISDSIFEANITVYPNPSKGIITIDLGNLLGDFSYEVINTIGQKLMAGSLVNNASEINLENLETNVYFVKITDNVNLKTIVKKIILQK